VLKMRIKITGKSEQSVA